MLQCVKDSTAARIRLQVRLLHFALHAAVGGETAWLIIMNAEPDEAVMDETLTRSKKATVAYLEVSAKTGGSRESSAKDTCIPVSQMLLQKLNRQGLGYKPHQTRNRYLSLDPALGYAEKKATCLDECSTATDVA